MAAATQQDWHAEAVELRQQGLSERQIAETVGKSRSTVHDFLASVENRALEPQEPVDFTRRVDPTPGQQTIDGREVPVETYVEQIRVDGTILLR